MTVHETSASSTTTGVLVQAAAPPSAAAPAGATPVAGALLVQLAADHPVLAGLPGRERLLAGAWLAGYRSARTRRAYAGDLAAWLDWLAGLEVDVLDARRVHVDLWARHLLDSGAAASSTTRRLSAVQLCRDGPLVCIRSGVYQWA